MVFLIVLLASLKIIFMQGESTEFGSSTVPSSEKSLTKFACFTQFGLRVLHNLYRHHVLECRAVSQA